MHITSQNCHSFLGNMSISRELLIRMLRNLARKYFEKRVAMRFEKRFDIGTLGISVSLQQGIT